MITLNEELLIASGGIRNTYQHPQDSGICIKVDRNSEGSTAGTTVAEAHLFEKLMKQRDHRGFSVISNYRGSIETNLGFGAMYDLIRDECTGYPSRVLLKVLQEEPDFIQTDRFKQALKMFRRDLIQEAVLCQDIRPWNICVQELTGGKLKLVLIDGVGHKKKPWFENIKPFIQLKMLYYFFSKYIYPEKRLLQFYNSNRRHYNWKSGPMFSEKSEVRDKVDANS